ncbi:FAD-dependent monooxygenase [Sphingobium chungbukense]|uniref:FAD-binding domain-containing protein n=1 Tax=Sphingobium chungbukense TaxID=56193 RepID=A0A0M3ANW9_9SPHN|nr:FAD-dependent monooxygenase [Sphingobium chungbukense]KKW91638.1 hypothetical protein YP76_14800 [Sphingobium chungbukense]
MTIETQVLVVGAGPVGLALAIELGTHGIHVIVVEKSDRTGDSPRAKTTNVRTRTLLRRWGIADRLAEASPFGVDYPNDVKFVTSLAGNLLANFPNAFNGYPVRADEYPEHAQWIPQYTLERILLEHASSLPTVEIRLGAAFIGAGQDEGHVTSSIETRDGSYNIRSAFLVGADGSRSSVRNLIGAKMEGRSRIVRAYNIVFRAPGLATAHRQGPAVIYWQVGPSGLSTIGPMDQGDLWFFMPAFLDENETLTHEEAIEQIKMTTGIDLPYEILSADIWYANELVADRHRLGRIFLAGDACHLHPPFGGHGMNMGVGDAVDLGWKIAAQLKDWGGPRLLDSYQSERRPIHQAVVNEAISTMREHVRLSWRPELDEASPEGDALRDELRQKIESMRRQEFYSLGTVLGLRYEGSPIILSEPGEAPPHVSSVYTPSARPGGLAPHAWLPDGRSLYDLFGNGFAIVASSDVGEEELDLIRAEAEQMKLPLEIARPDGINVTELYGARLALVRPDQYVAWRGDQWEPVLAQAAGW